MKHWSLYGIHFLKGVIGHGFIMIGVILWKTRYDVLTDGRPSHDNDPIAFIYYVVLFGAAWMISFFIASTFLLQVKVGELKETFLRQINKSYSSVPN